LIIFSKRNLDVLVLKFAICNVRYIIQIFDHHTEITRAKRCFKFT